MNRVDITWERRPKERVAQPVRRLVRETLKRLGRDRLAVALLVTGDRRIQELNRRYLDRDRPTDVLSFPDGDALPDGFVLCGQIVISLDTALRQARELGHPLLRELEELVLHGLLHLLGYDHEADHGEMEALELRLREELL